jgi:hypothetical protein
MLSFLIDGYTIEVSDSASSATNPDFLKQFDNVYISTDHFALISAVAVKFYEGGELIKSALIGGSGGATGVSKTSIIADNHNLTGCCCDTVFCLSLPELKLLWQTRADEATCFQIFKYRDDYIVHGELEISRIDQNGKIVWRQSGGDIFTTIEGKPDDFKVMNEYILATDWNHKIYKFDFDGNIME